MDITHDPVRHLRYLRESLSQDNEAIGFFLSAGCPLAVRMPENAPLIPDVAGLTRYIESQLGSDSDYARLLEEFSKAGGDKNNIEKILSFVRNLHSVSKGAVVRGLSESQLARLDKEICQCIVRKLDVALPTDDTPYHRLANWIRSIERRVAVEIFTTNYDLLAEQGLESAEVPYFDGFVGSRGSFFDLRALDDNLIPNHWTRLWKIHGSINWHQEPVGDSKRVCRSSEVKMDAAHLIYPSHLKYEESRKMPYLALLDQLNRFIRRKSSLLVLCGYSFNDSHLNDVISNALKANPTAMVLALMFDTFEVTDVEQQRLERYPIAFKLASRQHNLNVWTFDKAIIGTNTGAWKLSLNEEGQDSGLTEFVTKAADSEGAQSNTVRLGDFNEFSLFLKRIIGARKENSDG